MIRVWESGAEIEGRYRLVEKIGEGGVGSVWRAEHMLLGTPVAIKLLSAHAEQDDDSRARFLREARANAFTRGHNVVQLLDFGVVGRGIPYLVMELLEGENLHQRLGRLRGLDASYTAWMLDQVAYAVGKAHRMGIWHRDLKPANIFLHFEDEIETPKVLDFGLAKLVSPEGVPGVTTTSTGMVLGTPFYMSPEQIRGGKHVDHRSDLWSMSIIAYECMTGVRPYEKSSLGDLVMAICQDPIPPPSTKGPVPDGFDDWFARATDRDKDERFQSAQDWADALCRVLGLADEQRRHRAAPAPATGLRDLVAAPRTQPPSGSDDATTKVVPMESQED
jgi:serine/threonine-protein kinase